MKSMKARWADAGAVVAAAGASACCLGPFVLVALGAGAAAGAVSAFFAPLRPWLMAIAFGIVGWRLFVLYRPTAERSAAAGPSGGDACCAAEAGAACPPDARRRERILTWGVLALVAVFAASPHWISALPWPTPARETSAASVTPPPARSARAERCFAIEGMVCSACAGHIEAEVGRVPGVVADEVSYDRAEACVEVDGATDADIVAAVARAGYRASPKGL